MPDKHLPDKPAGRVVALIVLLIVVGAALRGYLPPRDHSANSDPVSHRAALMFVVASLSGALAVLAVAIIARLRDPRAVAPSVGDLSHMLGRDKVRPSWRVVVIGIAMLVAWLLIVIVITKTLGLHSVSSGPQTAATTPPPSQGTGGAKPKQQPKDESGDVIGILLASMVPLVVIIVTGGVITMMRRRRAVTPETDDEYDEPSTPPTRSESLARAAEVGLAEIEDHTREPREAIIACYAAMERELANVPGAAPQDFDTPTEVLARAVERHALQADSAIQLVNLFAEARFSPHVMNEGHREVAVRVLQLVLDELSTNTSRGGV